MVNVNPIKTISYIVAGLVVALSIAGCGEDDPTGAFIGGHDIGLFVINSGGGSASIRMLNDPTIRFYVPTGSGTVSTPEIKLPIVQEGEHRQVFKLDLESPEVKAVVDVLTNGVIQSGAMSVGLLTPTTYVGSEADIFQPTGDLSTGDYGGYTITGMEVRVMEFWAESPGSDLNGDGIWTSHRFHIEFAIVGF